MKQHRWRSLQPKLILGLVLMSVALTAVLITAIAHMYRSHTRSRVLPVAFDQASIAARVIDGDRIAGYYATGEKDAYYEEIREYLLMVKQTVGLKYFYVVVPEDEVMVYVWDAGEPGEEGVCDLGDSDAYYGGGNELMHAAFAADADQVILITKNEEYGYLASAYVAILDSAGEPVALASVDVSMDMIDEQISDFVGLALLITCGVLLLAGALYYFYIRRILIRPLGLLHQAARDLAENQMDDLGKFTLDIHTGDEIEDLAGSFQYMTRELDEYIRNLAQVTSEKERIGAELHVATQIQADMLPRIFPPFPERGEFDIYATMTPAKEVGGDFYDFFLIDRDHLAVVIADVSGKGVPAALFMVIAKTLIKNHTQAGREPEEVFTVVNNQLCGNNEAGMFVTAFLGVLEISTGRFTYVNAGHNPPLVSLGGKAYDWLPVRRGFVLAGMEDIRYRQQEIVFQPGDSLLLYTDGVTEALDPRQELYSEKRLRDFMNSGVLTDRPLAEQLRLLHADIEAFAAGAEQADDITMLLLQIKQITGGKEHGGTDD